MRAILSLLALMAATAVAFECPGWLQGLCMPVCIVKNCRDISEKCMQNKDCKKNFLSTLECMVKNPKTNITVQTACMVPDDELRDEAFNCMIEKHKCIKLPDNNPHYPTCRDTEIKGDANASLQNIAKQGPWYKVHSWKLGEPVECMDCQKAVFSVPEPDVLEFNSTWWEMGQDGKLHLMNVVSHMSVDHPRGPGKLYNTGMMFGLTYWEPYTIVKDGSLEDEPFVFFYVCGGTLQGNYTTAFAVAKTLTPTPTLHTRLAGIAESMGMKDSDFCNVNNTCFEHGGIPGQ